MNYACFIISVFFLSIAVVMAVMAVLLNLKKPTVRDDFIAINRELAHE